MTIGYSSLKNQANDDLLNVGAKDMVEPPSIGPSSGLGRQVNEQQGERPIASNNKDKEPKANIEKNVKEAPSDKLYTRPPSNDDTPKGSKDIEFKPRTIDDPQFCVELLFKDVYQFRKKLKKFTMKDGRDLTIFIKMRKLENY